MINKIMGFGKINFCDHSLISSGICWDQNAVLFTSENFKKVIIWITIGYTPNKYIFIHNGCFFVDKILKKG